jgi:hypothetical protein
MNIFSEFFCLSNNFSSCDSIAFNEKEFCAGPWQPMAADIAADVWGETGPLLGVIGYWVDNCFVLREKLLVSLQRGKAAQKLILSIKRGF